MKKIFWWIAGGVLLTTGSFFIPEQTGSMWPSVIASSVVATSYLIVFLAVWLREIQSSAKRKTVAVICTILLVFSLASAVISYENSVRQRESLANIRTHIETELAYTFLHKPLIKTLGQFHADNYDDMGNLFTEKYDSLIVQDSLFNYSNSLEDNETLYLFVSKTTADSVVLIGESSYITGQHSTFSNYSGKTGRYQVRGILTSKGVDYERQN